MVMDLTRTWCQLKSIWSVWHLQCRPLHVQTHVLVVCHQQIDPIIYSDTPSRSKSDVVPDRKECGDTSVTRTNSSTSCTGNTTRNVTCSHCLRSSDFGFSPCTDTNTDTSTFWCRRSKCHRNVSTAVTTTSGSSDNDEMVYRWQRCRDCVGNCKQNLMDSGFSRLPGEKNHRLYKTKFHWR